MCIDFSTQHRRFGTRREKHNVHAHPVFAAKKRRDPFPLGKPTGNAQERTPFSCEGTVIAMNRFLRCLSFLLCLSSIFLLCSCASAQRRLTPKELKNFPLEERFSLKTQSGEYLILLKMSAENCGSLSFLSPESLVDICFLVEGENCTVKTGSLTLPADQSSMPEKGLLLRAFSLPDEGTLLKSSKKEDGKDYTVYTYVDSGENYFYFFDENGALCRVDCEGSRPFSAVVQRNV